MSYEYQRWDYKMLTVKSDQEAMHRQELVNAGREGWELVGMVQLGPNYETFRYVFKRPTR
jgi:hypothetical protein